MLTSLERIWRKMTDLLKARDEALRSPKISRAVIRKTVLDEVMEKLRNLVRGYISHCLFLCDLASEEPERGNRSPVAWKRFSRPFR